jgi:hypothetical protein
MILTNKLLPVALIAALVGGSVGALVMHSRNDDGAEAKTTAANSQAADAQYVAANRDSYVPAEFDTSAEQTAYKSGFADGFRAAVGGAEGGQLTSTGYTASQPRMVYRNTARNSTSSRRVYYDYQQQPKGRSFWQKHRDKLTVAMGTGGGALIGGLIGGKKGAAIGALSGAGGSALYTYKLRNRSRRY